MKFASIFTKQLSKLNKSQSNNTFDEQELLIGNLEENFEGNLKKSHTGCTDSPEILRPATQCDPAYATRVFNISDKPI